MTRRRSMRARPRSFLGLSWRGLILLAVVLCGLIATVWLLTRRKDVTLVGDRQEFTSSACVEYAPTGTDRHFTVFLDPGHGGPDPGTSGTAPDGKYLQEKGLTLAVAEDMLPSLRSAGFHVVLSRTADVPVAQLTPGALSGSVYTPQGEHTDIEARIDCANAAHAQVLLSIHFDADADPTVGGVETAYDDVRPFSDESRRFASLVQQSILSGFAARGWTVPDRGVMTDSSLGTPSITQQAATYGHLLELGPPQAGWLERPSEMPGALTEPLFLTDPGEAAVIESDGGQQALAASLVHAIEQYAP